MLQCCCRSAIPVTASLGTTTKSHRAVMCAALLSRDDSCKPLATDSSPSRLEHQIQNASPLLTCVHFSTTVPAAAAVPPSLELSPKKCRRFYAGGIEERWIKAGRRKSSLSGEVEPPCMAALWISLAHLPTPT
ncbi:unnamed protein product [Sphagnum troendelagicum]